MELLTRYDLYLESLHMKWTAQMLLSPFQMFYCAMPTCELVVCTSSFRGFYILNK